MLAFRYHLGRFRDLTFTIPPYHSLLCFFRYQLGRFRHWVLNICAVSSQSCLQPGRIWEGRERARCFLYLLYLYGPTSRQPPWLLFPPSPSPIVLFAASRHQLESGTITRHRQQQRECYRGFYVRRRQDFRIFLNPPLVCPQNLFCLSANMGYLLTLPSPFCSDVIHGSPPNPGRSHRRIERAELRNHSI